MKITSMDISNKEFRKVIRGYDSNEVDEFLEAISEDYEVLYKENSALKEKVFMMNEKVDHYARMESTIQNTLLLAQNAAEQCKQTSQKEADLIIRNANDSAQKILDKAHKDVMQITDDYEKIKQEFMKFRTKFKNFMNSQVDMFNSLEKDFIKNYNIGNTVEDVKEKEIDLEDFQLNDSNDLNEKFRVKNISDEDFSANTLNEIKNFFVKED